MKSLKIMLLMVISQHTFGSQPEVKSWEELSTAKKAGGTILCCIPVLSMMLTDIVAKRCCPQTRDNCCNQHCPELKKHIESLEGKRQQLPLYAPVPQQMSNQ